MIVVYTLLVELATIVVYKIFARTKRKLIESAEKKGLVGEEVSEETAKQIASEFIGKDRRASSCLV